MYYDGIIYVIEAKGEIYNDWRKRMLLAKLDEIPGYKGLLVFSQQLDKMGDQVWDFKEFMNYAKKAMEKIELKKPQAYSEPSEKQVAAG